MKRRDWTAAREKCDRESSCRACGMAYPEAAHIWPRSLGGTQDPDLILPLCRSCHTAFDHHRLDVLSLLTTDEQVALVRAAGSLERARMRVLPSEYRRAA
jgi:hypothetical protein